MRFRTYLLLLIFIGLVVFFQTLSNKFVGDDDLQIVRNTNVHSIANIPSLFATSTYAPGGTSSQPNGIFYRPLMLSVFAILYSFFGAGAMMFHLVQLFIYIANAVLIFLLLRRYVKESIAFALSVIFLIHPINTEVALYSANLQEVLFFFFGMLSISVAQKKNIKPIYVLSLFLLLLLGLFSKETAILFILMIFTYAILFIPKRLKLFSIVSVCAVGIYLFFRYGVAHMNNATSSLAPITHAPLLTLLLNMPLVLSYYITTFFYPKELNTNPFGIITKVSLND